MTEENRVNIEACVSVDVMFTLSSGDVLLKPQTLKTLPFTLNRLTISLQPSLEKFESQLLQLINADCQNTVRPSFHNTHTVLIVFADDTLGKVR